MEVGRVYLIQARSFSFNHNGKDEVLRQDTAVEIKDIKGGKVTFWSSDTGKIYTIDTMGLKMVI